MSINQTLVDIARITGHLETIHIPERTPVEKGEYGDFEVKQHGPVSIFTPISDRAIRWVIEHVPEWVDRHGERGFILDRDEMDAVVAAAERDGCISCADYENAMNEMDALARQWELT